MPRLALSTLFLFAALGGCATRFAAAPASPPPASPEMAPAVLLMRHMARRDELIFRLLGLHWRFRLRTRNVRSHDGLWTYSANTYRDRPAANP